MSEWSFRRGQRIAWRNGHGRGYASPNGSCSASADRSAGSSTLYGVTLDGTPAYTANPPSGYLVDQGPGTDYYFVQPLRRPGRRRLVGIRRRRRVEQHLHHAVHDVVDVAPGADLRAVAVDGEVAPGERILDIAATQLRRDLRHRSDIGARADEQDRGVLVELLADLVEAVVADPVRDHEVGVVEHHHEAGRVALRRDVTPTVAARRRDQAEGAGPEPLDIERVVGLSEGNIFAGEFLAPQMFFFRPAPGW